MKKVSKQLIKRIDQINTLLKEVEKAEEIPTSYGGSTWPYYVQLEKPIKYSERFVWIYEKESSNKYGFNKRYNANNPEQLDELKYHLTLINRAFKKVIK